METPQCKTRPQAKHHFIQELRDLIAKLEEITGKKLTAQSLKSSMEKMSKKKD